MIVKFAVDNYGLSLSSQPKRLCFGVHFGIHKRISVFSVHPIRHPVFYPVYLHDGIKWQPISGDYFFARIAYICPVCSNARSIICLIYASGVKGQYRCFPSYCFSYWEFFFSSFSILSSQIASTWQAC